MALPTEKALEILQRYQSNEPLDSSNDALTTLSAQVDERHLAFDLGITVADSESSTIDKVTLLAYSILSAGASLAEDEKEFEETIPALEQAAKLLVDAHTHQLETNPISEFHVLIGAMAFYAAGQYSRAFVSLKSVENKKPLANIISRFIRNEFNEVIELTNGYLLDDLSRHQDIWELCDHSVTLCVSRALSFAINFFAAGNIQDIKSCDKNLNQAIELAIAYNSPSHWWIARLLKLMLSQNFEASLWKILPPYFPDDAPQLRQYTQLLACQKRPVKELWHSQIKAIPTALDNERKGAVVSMRTSAGKTRVAELAILQTLVMHPESKVLYLAPFRSLALEIEDTMEQVFKPLGYGVSHLYGGFRYNAQDKAIAVNASILIATPEKARAIFRTSPELFNEIKLIVIDEGHLIGLNERHIRNELFFDHLKGIAKSNKTRVLLLSAVLPNPEDIAAWLTESKDNVAESKWKPSSERLGILKWDGKSVGIDWKAPKETTISNYIQSEKLNWGHRRNPFPNNKRESVAATAVRLSEQGSVLIFVGKANSIKKLAESIVLALGENPDEFKWPEKEWRVFKLTCDEELGVDSDQLSAAKYGIIGHSNQLPPQVRMATERLMRSQKPRIVIATTTLAQGVNIGVSSVIISSPYIVKEPMTHRDFWNVSGRLGGLIQIGKGRYSMQ